MRWLPLLFAACATQSPSGPFENSRVVVIDVPADPEPKVDVLFAIDDSPAMAGIHLDAAAIAAQLADLPGGLPDLRVGVVTADPADGGALRGPVLAIAEDYFGARTQSFAGELADALAPQLAVGSSGAAPQPLAMAKLAAPGFHRADAALLVVAISAADDASPGEPQSYFTMPSTYLAAAIAGDAPRLHAATSLIFDLAHASDAITVASDFQKSTLQLFCVPSTVSECVASDAIDGEAIAEVPPCKGGERVCFELLSPGYCSAPDTVELRVKRAAMAPPKTQFHAECALP